MRFPDDICFPLRTIHVINMSNIYKILINLLVENFALQEQFK